MIDVFNSVLGHHFSTITTCQILEKPHHVVLSYICFPLLPFLIILNLCGLHSSHCLCSSFLLFARTLWSGRRFADLQLLSSQNFLSWTFWTLWAGYRHIEYSSLRWIVDWGQLTCRAQWTGTDLSCPQLIWTGVSLESVLSSSYMFCWRCFAASRNSACDSIPPPWLC